MVMALRVNEPQESNIGSSNTVHDASAPVRAMAHCAPDALHSVTVLNDLTSGRRAIQKNSPPIVGVADRNHHGASEC